MDDWVYELLTNEKVGSAELFKDNSAKKNQNGQMMDIWQIFQKTLFLVLRCKIRWSGPNKAQTKSSLFWDLSVHT